jgi:uncharacterized protein (TIGR01244 family)
MADIRKVTDDFAVAPQIAPAEVADIAARGYRMVINNRPDGETPDQPAGAEIAKAAEAAGLAYVFVPVRGGPTPDQVAAVQDAIKDAKGPVFAFCRSGTRSIVTWSIGQARAGLRSRDELIELGRNAGYDLTGPLASA